jgi:signal transduction histidine kinase
LKISLRYKLPLVIFCGFFVLCMILLLYYRLFLMDNLGRDFDVFKDHLYGINEDIAANIKKYYPDMHRIADYLERLSLRRDLKITVYDMDGNKIWVADRRKSRGLSLELKGFTVVNRDVVYLVELTSPFSIGNFSKLNSIRHIGWVALLLSLFFSGLLIIYLHFSLARPLGSLYRRLEKVNYRYFSDQINGGTLKRRDEIGDLTRKFAEMQQRLSTSYRRQNEMIASISHDLKTPLTSIIGFLERLISRNLSEQRQTEYHQIIFQKANDMKELITEFNDYALSDLDEKDVKKEAVNLREFLTDLTKEYRYELEGRNVVLNSVFNIDNNLGININRRKIRRVFANIINNSLKHAAGLSKINLKCVVRDGYVWFTLEDDGPGVSADELGVIFETFYRIDKSRTRSKGGSGLGLAICQRIVESHGGEIRAYLANEGGLGVCFSLPLRKRSS